MAFISLAETLLDQAFFVCVWLVVRLKIFDFDFLPLFIFLVFNLAHI